MTFTDTAAKLAGQCALTLGWRPDEFWRATPAELAAITAALVPHDIQPPDSCLLDRLKERFPDAPTGGD